MTWGQRWRERWELHGAAPAYGGSVAIGIGLCLFGAATNTMVGWLYAISGGLLALLVLAALLPRQGLQYLQIRRQSVRAVAAGDELVLELDLINNGDRWCGLLELHDRLPPSLLLAGQERASGAKVRAVEAIAPQGHHRLRIAFGVMQRGIYRWDAVDVRSGAPLGLFWSRRRLSAPARAVVYPTILPLNECPLLESLGDAASEQFRLHQPERAVDTDVVRGLRPYRSGDPLRLVHWRSSARYGELRVRELETAASGRELTIGLDNAAAWEPESFERAVSAAASICVYAHRRQLASCIWSAGTGMVRGLAAILEVLAGIQDREATPQPLPPTPLLWLTPASDGAERLPTGSFYLLFSTDDRSSNLPSTLPGLLVRDREPLQAQLQQRL